MTKRAFPRVQQCLTGRLNSPLLSLSVPVALWGGEGKGRWMGIAMYQCLIGLKSTAGMRITASESSRKALIMLNPTFLTANTQKAILN